MGSGVKSAGEAAIPGWLHTEADLEEYLWGGKRVAGFFLGVATALHLKLLYNTTTNKILNKFEQSLVRYNQ